MATRVVTPDGLFCGSCGNPADSDIQLCVSCGQPFEGDVPGTKCPQCGRAVDERDAKCPACGTSLPALPSLPTAHDLIAEIKAFRRQAVGVMSHPSVPGTMPQETEAALLAELESLWKLAEPFERVVAARRKRLEQMDRLIAAARRRVREIEESDNPAEAREREELKRQVQEVLMERDEILKIEYGITEMERVYRNIITMQQKQLHAKDEALKARLEGARKEIGSMDQERSALEDRERELEQRERDLEARSVAQEAGPHPAGAPENRGVATDGRPRTGGVTRDQWLAAQKEVQASLFQLRGAQGEIVLPTASNVRDLRMRVNELEEAIETITDQRNRMEADVQTAQALEEHVREVLREVDELLGRLPDAEIKRFALSKGFKQYEELMERLGL